MMPARLSTAVVPVTMCGFGALKRMGELSTEMREGSGISTDQLIERLVADLRPLGIKPRTALLFALVAAVIVVAALFSAILGLRADLAVAITSLRFPFKVAVVVTLALGAFLSLRISAYPGADWRLWHTLLPATLLISAGMTVELFSVPPADWAARTMGQNSLTDVTAISLLGLLPLCGFITALRYGAPPRPGSAGMLAGVLSGAIAATFYAAHGADDSPLFLAAWYSLAIGALAVIGAAAGRLFIRW